MQLYTQHYVLCHHISLIFAWSFQEPLNSSKAFGDLFFLVEHSLQTLIILQVPTYQQIDCQDSVVICLTYFSNCTGFSSTDIFRIWNQLHVVRVVKHTVIHKKNIICTSLTYALMTGTIPATYVNFLIKSSSIYKQGDK